MGTWAVGPQRVHSRALARDNLATQSHGARRPQGYDKWDEWSKGIEDDEPEPPQVQPIPLLLARCVYDAADAR
jgi:hypothetical protein